MTGQQQIAFGDPCYNAEDTIDGGYRSRVEVDGRRFGVVLTLNVGLE